MESICAGSGASMSPIQTNWLLRTDFFKISIIQMQGQIRWLVPYWPNLIPDYLQHVGLSDNAIPTQGWLDKWFRSQALTHYEMKGWLMHLFLEMLGELSSCCMSISDEADDSRVETKLNVFPGLPHGFILAVNMELSSQYFCGMVEWVDERLKINNKLTELQTNRKPLWAFNDHDESVISVIQ